MADPLQAAFSLLWSVAIVLSSVSVMFGIYSVLFVLAVWATSDRKGPSRKGLRVVTWLLFIDLLLHYSTRIVVFSRTHNVNASQDEETRWMTALLFIGSITVTIAGLLSDGLVAWRFYVIYERKRWAMYGPACAVILNTVLGLSGDIQYLLGHGDITANHFVHVAFKITVVWGYCMLAINAVLTGAITGKIIYVARRVTTTSSSSDSARLPYKVIVEAIIESALINFVGILLYEIATVAPTGTVEQDFGVGYVFYCILPMFFGISQCLITVRLCLVETVPQSRLPSTNRLTFLRSQNTTSTSTSTRMSRLSRSNEDGSKGTAIELPPIVFAAYGHEACQFGKPCVAAVGQEKMECPVAGFQSRGAEGEDDLDVKRVIHIV